MHAFQERDERGRVCRLREYVSPDNELCLTAVLDVVGRLQLAVLHGVLFHTHEGSVCICLGEAVPASAGVQFPMIVLQPPDVFVKRFRQPLQWRFASADAVHEDDALLLLVSGQSAAQLFEMMHLDGFAVPDTDAGIRAHLLQKIRQLSLQLGKILLHGFLPDESVLVGGRLNLGTVDEDVLERDSTDFFQPVGHLCQQFLRAGGNMLRPETSNGSVIRSRFPLEQVHEIDIAAAGTFDTPRAVDTIQVSVDKDGEHLPRLHSVLMGLRECLVKCG